MHSLPTDGWREWPIEAEDPLRGRYTGTARELKRGREDGRERERERENERERERHTHTHREREREGEREREREREREKG